MRACKLCGKTSKMGGERKLLRGHYNPVNWTRKYPNLQYTKVEGIRTLACTTCIRTLQKKAAGK
jgi:ribosomal protein L28